jgi:hypothetical protein
MIFVLLSDVDDAAEGSSGTIKKRSGKENASSQTAVPFVEGD